MTPDLVQQLLGMLEAGAREGRQVPVSRLVAECEGRGADEVLAIVVDRGFGPLRLQAPAPSLPRHDQVPRVTRPPRALPSTEVPAAARSAAGFIEAEDELRIARCPAAVELGAAADAPCPFEQLAAELELAGLPGIEG
jgi:hypothetical protein